MKKTLIIIVLVVIIILTTLVIPSKTSAPITQNPQPQHITYYGQCPGFMVTSPAAGSAVTFPLTLQMTVHPTGSPAGSWGVFEGQAGSVVVKDVQGNTISQAIPLSLGTQDWMTGDPISFSTTIPSITPQPTGSTVYFEFNDDDASGENPHQCILEATV